MKIGIIGCGLIAASHVRIIRKLMQNVELCLCDLERSNAEKLGSKFGINKIFTSAEELVSNQKLDTVHILTPVFSHFDLAQTALQAGCHVYIEKPVTESTLEYNRLFALAKKQKKLMCAGYSALGMPAVLAAKELIHNDDLGRLISLHCDFMCSWPSNTIPYGNPNHWAYSMTGGIYQNIIDHPASLVTDAMDGVQKYHLHFCRRNILPFDCPDLLHVTLSNDHQIGSFVLSLGHGSAHRQIQYLYERGTISVDLGRQLVSFVGGTGPQNFIQKTLSGLRIGWDFAGGSVGNVFKVITGSLQKEPGIVNLINNFYNSIRGDEELIVENETALRVIGLLEGLWKELNYKPNNIGLRTSDR